MQSDCGELIFINGGKVLKTKQLHHNDRLVFAGSACFLVNIPAESPNHNLNQQNFEDNIDWEFVQKELLNNEYDENRKIEEKQEKEKEILGFLSLFSIFG